MSASDSDPLWDEADLAAENYYRNSEAPHRAVKQYAYAMGYYHAKKKPNKKQAHRAAKRVG